MNDVYWGGEQRGGKRGRGSSNKTPFVAAVSLNKDVHPIHMRMSVLKGFRSSEVEGFGIAILPDFTVQQAIQDNTLVRALEDWDISSSYQGVINLQYASNPFMPAKLRVFIDFIEANLCKDLVKP